MASNLLMLTVDYFFQDCIEVWYLGSKATKLA